MAGKILVPTRSFNVWVGGRLVTFREGRTTIREGHPILEGREDRFRPLKVQYDVETRPQPVAAGGRGGPLEARRQLVAQAKALGVKASGKTAEIEAAIAATESGAGGDD